jgi:hypothetical protein
LTIWPGAGRRLVFATVAIALVNATSATSTGGTPEGPSAQITDRLEAPGHPSAQSPSAALYTTEVHATNVEEAPEGGWEMEGTIHRLPCALREYRFIATTAAIDSSQASSFETFIRVYSVNLPRGVTCGSALATRGQARVEIEPVGAPASSPVRYASERITIESFRSCVTLDQACPGRYMLIVQVASGGRQIRLVYAFAVVAPGTRPP